MADVKMRLEEWDPIEAPASLDMGDGWKVGWYRSSTSEGTTYHGMATSREDGRVIYIELVERLGVDERMARAG